MGHNVEFYPLGGDPKELAAYMVKTGGHLIPLSLEAIQKDVPRNMQMIEEIIQSTWPAVSEADPDGGGPGIPGKPFRAQAIIANPVSYGHIHVAERLGVPLHIMFPQPWVPTTAFPHPLSNMPYTNKPKKVNYMTYKLVDLLMWQGTEGMVNTFRTEVLELRKIRKGDGGRDILLDLAIPHAFMWSPHLVPKLKDWGQIYDVIGTVTLDGSGSSYSPTPEFEAHWMDLVRAIHLRQSLRPSLDPNGVTNMIIKAAEQAHLPARLAHAARISSGAPRWSRPTAAGLLAGKPTFIVPFFGDQPFWGRAVLDAGVGVEPCPISELTTEKLRLAFERLSSPELRKRAIELRDLMRQEDGAGEAVRCFYSNLPVHLMRCDLDCGRAAMLWSQKDKLSLCNKCEFVVTSRPENSPSDIVEYTYVDYSGRGPDNMLEGASSGVGAMAHAIGSGIKDVLVKPTQGYREEGAKGAVVGLVKGLGGLMISPLVGTMVFADYLATGAYNNGREKNEKKRGSLIKGNNKFLDIMGFKSRNVHTSSMNTDEVVDGENPLSRQIAIELTPREKNVFEVRFHAFMMERGSYSEIRSKSSVSVSSDGTRVNTEVLQRKARITEQERMENVCLGPQNNMSMPKMNICMMTVGRWSESVHQFVAIGLQLKADGHCVRIATNIVHRDRVVGAGLKFYPLKGSTTTVTKFLEYVHHQVQHKTRSKPHLLNVTLGLDPFSDMDDLRELVFSLWPACVGADPLIPGEAFRADTIIAHPSLFGHTVVAERLGIPLHSYSGAPANVASYDVVDKLAYDIMGYILDEFRYSLGLTGKTPVANLLTVWRIPHTYLWNPVLLPKPHDWRSEITLAGYTEFKGNDDFGDCDIVSVEHELRSFTENHVGTPIIYFGFQCDDWDSRRVQELMNIVVKAALTAGVCIIFQGNKIDTGRMSGNDIVFKIDRQFPVKRILSYVDSTVHWGDLSITST